MMCPLTRAELPFFRQAAAIAAASCQAQRQRMWLNALPPVLPSRGSALPSSWQRWRH